ncbi:hypothetical protein [Litoribacillus peritrichatus]|uniref:HEAT repeat domain-containing protein n=1 Tax=Litoribacillus peritrichatus TaxID=718191 RepID=A0ABP7MZ13_9GAMM
MDFFIAIRRWNGKSSEDIESLYTALVDQPDFEDRLVSALAGDEEIHRGASWLLKHHLEHRHALTDAQVSEVLDQLPLLKNWEAKLHILQCLTYIAVPLEHRNTVEEFVRSCLTEINKFVRAWAYNAMFELACQFPDLQPEVEVMFEAASEDEAASVKARVRNIQKQGFPVLNQAS